MAFMRLYKPQTQPFEAYHLCCAAGPRKQYKYSDEMSTRDSWTNNRETTLALFARKNRVEIVGLSCRENLSNERFRFRFRFRVLVKGTLANVGEPFQERRWRTYLYKQKMVPWHQNEPSTQGRAQTLNCRNKSENHCALPKKASIWHIQPAVDAKLPSKTAIKNIKGKS